MGRNLNITINLDNSAFDYMEQELNLILDSLVDRILNSDEGIIRDSIGNRVGKFIIEED